MQFLFLVIVNIIMAVIFYLILTLKLEKSASQFKEQKLRREMDEIIKEFNAAAERNISLLENKISIMKKLLETSGNKKNLNILLHDTETQELERNMTEADDYRDPAIHTNVLNDASTLTLNSENQESIWGRFKKNVHEQLDKYKNKPIPEEMPSTLVAKKPKKSQKSSADAMNVIVQSQTADTIIEKDLSHIKLDNNEDTDNNRQSPSGNEDEIFYIMENSKDRFSLISALHDKGYTVEIISRYSGIPEGEVKLVLNLSK